MDSNKIRHKTLAILYDSRYRFVYNAEENKTASLIDVAAFDIPLTVFLKKLHVTEREFRMANTLVVHDGEVQFRQTNGVECLSLENPGLSAFVSKKYLKLKYQERNEKYYSVTKWAIPIASLLIAGTALFITLNNRNTIQINLNLKSNDTTNVMKIDSAFIK